jgi:hypothetical protein
VAALVEVEWSLARFPTWIPNGIAVFDIKVSTAVVHWYIIVAIAGDATELGILIERIATSGIRD